MQFTKVSAHCTQEEIMCGVEPLPHVLHNEAADYFASLGAKYAEASEDDVLRVKNIDQRLCAIQRRIIAVHQTVCEQSKRPNKQQRKKAEVNEDGRREGFCGIVTFPFENSKTKIGFSDRISDLRGLGHDLRIWGKQVRCASCGRSARRTGG